MIPRFYCEYCGKFKNRFQVKRKDDTRVYWYECKWCHNHVNYTRNILEKYLSGKGVKEWNY